MQREQLLREKEQAKQLKCSLRHLINLRNKRLIPFIRLGRSIRYDPTAVQHALEKLTVRER
jgi:Helix-turn-helix domain